MFVFNRKFALLLISAAVLFAMLPLLSGCGGGTNVVASEPYYTSGPSNTPKPEEIVGLHGYAVVNKMTENDQNPGGTGVTMQTTLALINSLLMRVPVGFHFCILPNNQGSTGGFGLGGILPNINDYRFGPAPVAPGPSIVDPISIPSAYFIQQNIPAGLVAGNYIFKISNSVVKSSETSKLIVDNSTYSPVVTVSQDLGGGVPGPLLPILPPFFAPLPLDPVWSQLNPPGGTDIVYLVTASTPGLAFPNFDKKWYSFDAQALNLNNPVTLQTFLNTLPTANIATIPAGFFVPGDVVTIKVWAMNKKAFNDTYNIFGEIPPYGSLIMNAAESYFTIWI